MNAKAKGARAERRAMRIGAVVRSLKGMTKIPGIEAYSVEEPVR